MDHMQSPPDNTNGRRHQEIDALLHDAVLTTITVDWAKSEASIRLKLCATPSRECTVVAQGLRTISCTHRKPWGDSASVNTTSFMQVGAIRRITIEMQSGDTITIDAALHLLDGQPV